MTLLEFSNEFDILYNSIATNNAPNIDLYEKSVYLTKAQLEIINNYFNPKGNKYQEGFEHSSKRRNDLSELIKTGVSVASFPSTMGISNDSQFFKIDSNVYLILQEKALVESDNKCINNTYINIKPKTHDEFNALEENPFKKPDKSVIWRLDFSKQGNNRNVELISPFKIIKYKYRYVKYPKPIILTNLNLSFSNENLSIDGQSFPSICELNESVHREILNRAVELATADYKPENLAIKAQINTRNE